MTAAPGEAWAFLQSARTYAGADCLLWPFSVTKRGYAKVAVKRRTKDAARVLCELVYGMAPPRHEVAHWCGNRRCVNPQHLRWATRAANHADKLRHGTHHRGERCPTHKLTRRQVLTIRRAPTSCGLAQAYGVSRAQILRIRRRQQWAWL